MTPRIHGAELEALIARMKGGLKNRYNWVEWPRGFLKSTTFTQGFSVWLVAPSDDKDRECAIREGFCSAEEWDARAKLRNQNYAQLLAFESAVNAEKKLSHIRRFFESYELFRAAFPEIAYTGRERPWNDSAFTIPRNPDKHVPPDPTFEAKGVGGALQSAHYDAIWTDDIVGEKAMKSEVILEDTKTWFGRLNGVEQLGGRTWRFGVSNRWGYNDINSHLRHNEPHWHFSNLNAWDLDEQGKPDLTWPEVYSMEVLEQKRASMSDEDFYTQYLNRPRPPGDAEFSHEKIHKFKMVDGVVHCSCGGEYPVGAMHRWVHYDPYSAKGSRSKSLPAIAAVGMATDRHVFLLEPFTKKASYDRIFAKLFEMNTRWDPLFLTYEDVGAQNMAAQYIKEYQRRPDFKARGLRPFRRIVPVKTGGKPMEIRIRDYFSPIVEKGMFGVHESHRMLFDMIETFPHAALGHDYDLMDCLAQGARVWRPPVDSEAAEEARREEEQRIEKLGQGYTPWAA